MAKRGRPKKNVTRVEGYHIRFYPGERKMLSEIAKERSIPTSELIRISLNIAIENDCQLLDQYLKDW